MSTGYQGKISIGGTELREASAASLRRMITVVSAGSYIFSGSVRQTLREGKPDVSDIEMETALRRAGLLDFVRA